MAENKIILPPQMRRNQKSLELLKEYHVKLQAAVEMFYNQVKDDDDDYNVDLFENFHEAWMKTAQAVNSTQSHTVIDVHGFQKEIVSRMEIAQQEEQKLKENETESEKSESAENQ